MEPEWKLAGLPSRVVAGITRLLLGLSGLLALVWFVTAQQWRDKFEPAVDVVGVLGTIIGLFAERRARRREVQQQVLRTISSELDKNETICRDPGFAPLKDLPDRPFVYARLLVSAVDAGFTSSAVFELDDDELLDALNAWRDLVRDFNRRLDLTELRGFTVDDPTEWRDMHELMVRQGSDLDRLRNTIAMLKEMIDARRRGASSRGGKPLPDEAGVTARPSPAARTPADPGVDQAS